MEAYRKKLKTRIVLLGIVCIIAAVMGIYDGLILKDTPSKSDVFSFQIGLAIGFEFLAVVQIFRYNRILKDEKKIQLEYNRENDERGKEIRRKAGMPMLMITSGLMIAAGIAAGYFNTVIFITLIAAAICQMTIGAGVKLYYMKKL